MRALLESLGASLLAVVAAVLIVTLVAPAGGRPATAGHNLSERVRSVGNGEAYFQFDTWPDVRGDDDCNISRGDPDGDGTTFHGDVTVRGGRVESRRYTESGPMNVRLRVRGGRLTRLQNCVGAAWRENRRDLVNLGHVTAAEATEYLLGVAATTDGDVAESAVCAAVFIRDGDIWPGLFKIARDRSRPHQVRSSALFWIGQEAGTRAMAELVGVAEADDEDTEVRESAVFALSQRPEEESIPVLTRLARTSRHPEVRKSAFFWLAQHDDPAVIDLFEEILGGK